MMKEIIRHSVGSHPSSPKTLPPTTMGFGGTGTDADMLTLTLTILYLYQVDLIELLR
jgi:hypothetical protein